jgi:peptidoglycan/xylan/chitin deacetylase (PgdA/CDA1 family)
MKPPLQTLHLLYHELRPEPSAYSYALETAQFQRHLNLYVHLRARGQSELRPEITFDDGHISNYELALPLLQARGIQARFFITVGWTGHKSGYMGWPELRALQQAGQDIGAHGWTHTLLTHCSGKDLHRELEKARYTLQDKLGISVTTMSLPGGRFNRRVLAACNEAGYTRVYTSVPQPEPEPLGFTVGRLNIRREMQPDWVAALFQSGNRSLASLKRQYQRKQTAQRLLGDRLYERLWAMVNRQEPDTGGEGAATG